MPGSGRTDEMLRYHGASKLVHVRLLTFVVSWLHWPWKSSSRQYVTAPNSVAERRDGRIGLPCALGSERWAGAARVRAKGVVVMRVGAMCIFLR